MLASLMRGYSGLLCFLLTLTPALAQADTYHVALGGDDVAGDGSGVSRGIVGAAATGIIAARGIASTRALR